MPERPNAAESPRMSERLQQPEGISNAQPHIHQTVADAPKGNWVDLYAPAATRPYLRLSRADRPIGTWLLLVPCFWGIALAALETGYRTWDIWLVLSCGVGAFLMRGAGCTWNDISDRDIDGAVARTRSRPLPSGAVTVKGALVWMAVQALLAALILFTYNWLAVGLGIASLALVAIYPFAKRFTWWPQVFLGLAFNWGAILAFAAHRGVVDAASVALYAAGICWTLYYDTIYAHQDKEDDALIGVKSTARLFGAQSRGWLWGFMACTVVLLTLAVLLALRSSAGNLSALAVALLGIWAFGWHMTLQMRRLDLENPDSCMKTFRSNRDAGLVVALFLAVAAWL